MKVSVCLGVLAVLFICIEDALCQLQYTTSYPQRVQHNRNRSSAERQNSRTVVNTVKSNRTVSRTKTVQLADRDKYYEDSSGDSDDYVYGEYDSATTNDSIPEEDKFIETGSGIIFDHVDFVLLRLKHIAMRTSNNISEILALQKKEFKVNKSYKEGWEAAVKAFNETMRVKIFNGTSKNSIIRKVPIAYHIAIIAYTDGEPAMYADFNRDTREICSGNQVDSYNWKSYFKLLQLAIAALGSETRWKDNRKYLYRGAGRKHHLKEGQVLAFQHFVSTSAALLSAEEFAGETLFEFQGFYNGTAMAVWDHSYYPQEQEVLFSPLQVFQVDSIHVGKYYTRYVLVKHELPLPCDKKDASSSDKGNDISVSIDKLNALRVQSSSGSSSRGNQGIFVVLLVTSFITLQIN